MPAIAVTEAQRPRLWAWLVTVTLSGCHCPATVSVLRLLSLKRIGFNRAARSDIESPQIKVCGYVYPQTPASLPPASGGGAS